MAQATHAGWSFGWLVCGLKVQSLLGLKIGSRLKYGPTSAAQPLLRDVPSPVQELRP